MRSNCRPRVRARRRTTRSIRSASNRPSRRTLRRPKPASKCRSTTLVDWYQQRIGRHRRRDRGGCRRLARAAASGRVPERPARAAGARRDPRRRPDARLPESRAADRRGHRCERTVPMARLDRQRGRPGIRPLGEPRDARATARRPPLAIDRVDCRHGSAFGSASRLAWRGRSAHRSSRARARQRRRPAACADLGQRRRLKHRMSHVQCLQQHQFTCAQLSPAPAWTCWHPIAAVSRRFLARLPVAVAKSRWCRGPSDYSLDAGGDASHPGYRCRGTRASWTRNPVAWYLHAIGRRLNCATRKRRCTPAGS